MGGNGDITDYRSSSVVARGCEASQHYSKLSFLANLVNISDVPLFLSAFLNQTFSVTSPFTSVVFVVTRHSYTHHRK